MPLAVCATPIGNLEDVTLRVLAELRDADVILAEDTRHTRGLLERHGIATRLLSYHEHNEAARVAELLPRLEAGERVALVSSGLAGGRYAFVGFLPRKAGELDALWRELAAWPWPVVAFESAQRLGASLRSLAAVDAQREVAVCRELTKRFEEVARGTAAELAARFAEPPKGEVTVVVGPAREVSDASAAHEAVAALVAAGTPRGVAAEVVARLTDTSRNDLYRSSL